MIVYLNSLYICIYIHIYTYIYIHIRVYICINNFIVIIVSRTSVQYISSAGSESSIRPVDVPKIVYDSIRRFFIINIFENMDNTFSTNRKFIHDTLITV